MCWIVGWCGRGLTLTLSQSSNRRLPAPQGRWWKKSAPATSSVVTISLFDLSSIRSHPPSSILLACSPMLPPLPPPAVCGVKFDPRVESASAQLFQLLSPQRAPNVEFGHWWGSCWSLSWVTEITDVLLRGRLKTGTACTCRLSLTPPCICKHASHPSGCFPLCPRFFLLCWQRLWCGLAWSQSHVAAVTRDSASHSYCPFLFTVKWLLFARISLPATHHMSLFFIFSPVFSRSKQMVQWFHTHAWCVSMALALVSSN